MWTYLSKRIKMGIKKQKNTKDISYKLKNLCNLLRDDGISNHQYVTELTYLLLLKMAQETGQESQLPKGYRWSDIVEKAEATRLSFYKRLIIHLASHGSRLVKKIFENASSSITNPVTFSTLIAEIDKIDWFSGNEDRLGDIYEVLLEKNNKEIKKGAGQYFTPRVLINVLVELIKPQLGEVIQDPSAGTGGFLIAANNYLRQHNDFGKLNKKDYDHYRNKTFYGMEMIPDTHRLALINMMLHDLDNDNQGSHFMLGDTLSPKGQNLPKADIILANPPYGTQKGGRLPTRSDLNFPTSNKQLAFLEHIYCSLKPGGRAAVVIPDNVLFFIGKIGKNIRADLMDKCNLHTILKLPIGIFYAKSIRTNVLFFTRGNTDKDNTQNVWVYDLRTNMPKFSKRNPLTHKHFLEFIKVYGSTATRKDTGEKGRFRCFSRKQIKERDENLYFSWIKDDSLEKAADLPEPKVLVKEIINKLQEVITDMKNISTELGIKEKIKAAE